MRIKDVMTKKVLTVEENTSIHDAMKLLREKKIRRLPVVKNGKLVGIVTERMLLEASPSQATTLSIHELHYLLAKMVVKDIMVKKPITVEPNTPAEEVLRLGEEKGIGAFPVVDDGKLVGIATESDIVSIMNQVLGVREKGIRIDIEVNKEFGNLQKIMNILDGLEIPLLSLMIYNCPVDEGGGCHIFLRLARGNGNVLAKKFKDAGFKVLDVD